MTQRREYTHRLSGKTRPSSTQVTVVISAPMFTTHALERPAPKVAQRDSCKQLHHQILEYWGQDLCGRGDSCLLHRDLFEADSPQHNVGEFTNVLVVIQIRDDKDGRKRLL
jgi:hypothetical protein